MTLITCGSCGAERPAGQKFCDECGARLVDSCGSCGAELRSGARFCGECGTPQTTSPESPESPGSPAVVAERKVTSVLFADLVGFTTLSEARDKEDVRELLSAYFEQCRRVVARYGGTVEKFIGDAVMAVWGVPLAHDDDAERAVRAGLELVRAVDALGDDVAVPGLAMRVGVVTGEVAVTLGARHEGMVAGDAVNTASRVQSVASPGEVWVDESTRLLTAAAIRYRDVGSHPLKGKADPVPLWEAEAVVAAIGGAQRADGLESPLAGRARELRLVKELFHGVEETGHPALVLVEGDPGVGKSRLGWEFEKYIDGLTTSTAWHDGRCIAYGEGVAFWPIAEAIRGRLGLIESDEDADPVAAVDTGLSRYVADRAEAEWLRPRLLALIGGGAVGTYDRDDLFAAWRTFLERTREDDPAVVLLIDDAQHADEGTLLFLEHLLANSAAPLFVMVMARPGLIQRWPAIVTNRRSTVLHLPVLQAREMAELLDGLVRGMPGQVRDRLVERAEGVPLYAMETVRSLIDRDIIVPRGGVYVLPDPAALDLASIGAPASLQAVVAARLDGLRTDQRRVVQDASLLGDTFTREALAALSAEVADLDDVLASLCRLEIFGTVANRLSTEYGQYRFVQAVVRQVAYATLSRRERKARHLATARFIEAIDDPGGDWAPILAQHYLDAVDAGNAADPDVADLLAGAREHLVRAATRARSLGAPAEALRYLEVAMDRAGTEASAQLHLEAARAANEAGRPDAALAHADAAHDGFVAAADPIGAGAAAAARAWTLAQEKGDHAGCLQVATPHWEALQNVPGAERVLLELSSAMMRARYSLSQPAPELNEARIRIAEALGDRPALAEALVSFGVPYVGTSPTLAKVLTRAGADIAAAEQRPALLSRALSNLASMTMSADLAASVQYSRDALDAARRSGTSFSAGLASWNLVTGLVLQGGWDEASELIRTSTSRLLAAILPVADAVVSRARGVPRALASNVDDLAGSDAAYDIAWTDCQRMLDARDRGDLAAACSFAVRAAERLRDFAGVGEDFVLLWSLAVEVAMAAADRPVIDRLLGVVDDAPPGLVGAGLRAHRLRFGGLLGDASDTVGATLADAIAAFDAWGSTAYRARTQAELAGWLAGQGRAEDADPLRSAATDTLREIGAHGWMSELGLASTQQAAAAVPSR